MPEPRSSKPVVRGERRRFDPIHLLAYVILAGMFVFSQADVTKQATRACENVNLLKTEIRFVLTRQLPDKELERLYAQARVRNLELFAVKEC